MRLARTNAVVAATILAALIGSVAVASAGRIDLIAELQSPSRCPTSSC